MNFFSYNSADKKNAFTRTRKASSVSSRSERGFTTASERQNGSWLTFFLSAAGANPASTSRGAGFTILFAVIVSSAVLSIGISILGILQRQAVLISSSEASTRAFYAADTAMECTMYWDNEGAFPANADGTETISCAGDTSNITSDATPPDGDYAHVIQFEDPPTGSSDVCAQVRIVKTASGGDVDTEIEARGFSSCDGGDRTAERALRSVY